MTTSGSIPAVTEVQYFQITGVPGDYFVCPRYHGNAKLSTTACAGQWNRARNGGEDARLRLHACVDCPLGAKHAGVQDFKPRTNLQASKLCVRCHRPASRIIHNRLCVSCVNRQYEVQKGRNARGNRPTQCPDLKNIAVLVREGKKPAKPVEFVAEGMLEAVLSAMKTANDTVMVGFKAPPPRPCAQQLSMF